MLSHQKVYGQEGVIHTPVEKSRQAEAVQFLVDQGFATPQYLLNPDVLRLLEPAGSSDRIMQVQRNTLNHLLNDARIKRMAEIERHLGNAANPLTRIHFEDVLDEINDLLGG